MADLDLESLLRLAHISDVECNWCDRKSRVDSLSDLYREMIKKSGYVPDFPICYLPFELEDVELVEIGRKKFSKYSAIQALGLSTTKKNKPRIGIVSIDFRSHSNGVDLSPMFKSCRKEGIELYGYSFAEKINGVSPKQELIDNFDCFREISTQTMDEVAGLIASDLIDILVDTTRNIEGSPEELFLYKPAPIQVSGWGYGPSNGSGAFDYFISGNNMVLDAEESHYPESVVHLASYHPVLIEINSSRGIQNTKFPKSKSLTFGAFGATYKLRPELFDVWMEILLEIPESRLIMIVENQSAKTNITSYFVNGGLDRKRLQILDRLAVNDFRLLLNEKIDIVLDNPILGGSYAYVEAWKLGIPVVSYEANGFSGRGSACVARVVGGESLIAKDTIEYKAIALLLAKQELLMNKPQEIIEEYADLYLSLYSALDF